ncbi:MAG: efflux RND transporter permease subunit [Actinomycetota bacterium]
MKAIVRAFAAGVRRAPLAIVIATIVVAGILGSFAQDVEIATGNEGFAPDNAEIDALEQIGELFGTEQESVFQVIIRNPGGDVVTAEGLRTALAVEEAIRDVAGDMITDTPQQPGVVSFLAPAAGAAQSQGIPVEGIDDSTVDQLYLGALDQMPPEQSGFISGLLAEDADGATASAGLVLAFLEVENGGDTESFDAQIAVEEEIAAALDEIDSDLEVRPFSFNLLFGEVDEFTSEVGRLFAFAGMIIVAILLFVYWVRPRGGSGLFSSGRRTVADMALTLATILMAIGMMQGAGVLLERAGVISAFSAPTQVVPILIIGLGVDYAIHLISRYREEVGEGMSVDDSMSLSLETSGVALVLATLTTAIGFLTNLANPVPALTDFGILAALGIVFSFVLMMTFVPALRVLVDRRAEGAGRLPVESMGHHGQRLLPQLMGRTAVIAERVPYAALAVALVLGGFGYYGFTQLETRFSFTDFLPEDAPAVQTMEILESEFGGGFGEQTQVLVSAPAGGDLAGGEYWNRMLEANEDLAGVEWVFSFQTQGGEVPDADSPVSLLQEQFAQGPSSAPPPVLGAAQEVGLGTDLRVPDGADMMPLYDALREAAPERAEAVAHFQEGRLTHVLFDVRTSAGETEVSGLRDALDRAFDPLEEEGADAIATSQNIVGDVVVNELTASQSWSLFLTLAAAGVVLVLYFLVWNRRPFLGVITILPVVLVVMWTYGLMYATGIPFGPVTATLAALAIGIGVPYTIHLARRFEEDRNEMDDIEEAIRSTTTHTGGALAGSAFTTMAGFGILITSSLVPFRQMGQVTVFAIGLALVASILVLPSMLVLWEKWHRRRVGS